MRSSVRVSFSIVVLLVARGAYALPAGPSQPNDGVLAHVDGFGFSLAVDPGLDWRHDGVSDGLAVGGEAIGYYLLQHQSRRHAYEARVEGAEVALSHLRSDSLSTTALGLRLGTADVAYRMYPHVAWPVEIYGGVRAGLYDAGLQQTWLAGQRSQQAALPLSLSWFLGIGRLLPVTPRLALAQVERVLEAGGVIDRPLTESQRQAVLRGWIAARWELGHARHVQVVLDVLQDTGEPLPPLRVSDWYRLAKVVQTLREGDLPWRYSGYDVQWAARASRVWSTAASADMWQWAIEARVRQVFNLSVEAELWFEPAVGWAPRGSDASGNSLPGHTRLSLLGANSPAAAAMLPGGRIVMDLPVTYQKILYDAFYNVQGVFAAQAGWASGYDAGWQAGFTAGAAYTFFFSGTRGIKVSAQGGVGYLGAHMTEAARLSVAYVDGTGASIYVAPGDVVDVPAQACPWVPR